MCHSTDLPGSTKIGFLRIPVFQTGYTGIQEFEDHVQRKWSAVPRAGCSSSLLNLRRTLR